MFADTAEVSIAAGDGGRGAVSFRHEKFVDKGGPDGGDGGKGGNVVFIANANTNTLVDFRYKPNLFAKPGGAGGKNNRHGADGENLIVKVPVGTMMFREEKLLADLTKLDEKVVVAHGGDGGFGNAHFKSSTRQTPRVAEVGEKGEKFIAKLELKLLADVGLVGFPNAGKSTFLSVVSNAKPEIANYPFTTLTPNLGVAKVDDDEILIADIPGLIEGAAEGKGLGDEFLRHVERCQVILHLIDILSDNVASDYKKIREELKKYSRELAKKPEIVCLTKIDAVDDEIVAMQTAELKKAVAKSTTVFAISSSAHKNLREVLRAAAKIIAKEKSAQPAIPDAAEESLPTISLSRKQIDDAWAVEKVRENEFMVRGAKIEKFANRTDFANRFSVERLRDIMKKMGIAHELERQGATGDSRITIGDSELTFRENLK